MPFFIFYLILFLFGLTVGSFLNCVIYRLDSDKTFLKGRSFCPNCKKELTWQDLVPLFSFFYLKGRCRYCKKPISWQYPLVELTTALLFVLVLNYELGIGNCEFLNLQFVLDLLFLILVSSFLIVIFVFDLKTYLIPDKVIYPAIITVFIYRLLGILNFGHWNLFRISNFGFRISESFLYSLAAAFGAAVFFLLIVLTSQGKWMGVGDIKLAFFMGLFLGWPNILIALFIAFLLGAIIGIGLIFSGKKTLKSEVPFGPFLVTGTFMALFWGSLITKWYLNLFNLTI